MSEKTRRQVGDVPAELIERSWALSVILAHIPDNTLAFIARKMTLEENKRFMDVILDLMSQVKGREPIPSKVPGA